MMQITEDTPPDMLAGAMDLIVHLPTGRNVKMAVERSTPMMDLLVQITTMHQLQLSNYTLQALGMAPSSDHTDRILPYKPNTPIGTLDTQHIKVVPKTRTIPVPRNVPPGHQPFESTFRLKVHLPRNQLYVARVSRNVLLEDIMKRVCEEKNLDPVKYEFKHPGNIDETLDPKLTLSDYQITEIYVVAKGTHSLSQAFSTSDIMALRKEEERKQMHNKTGGGVFNLIFRRGKSSMGSGSVSSDTRSISPTHSDDSRSVTPPAAVQQPILPPPKQDPPPERPKPPQRKRRPAPKPPQPAQQPEKPPSNEESIVNDAEDARESRRNSEEKPPSTVSEVSELQSKKTETGLVICHSRNSSDSSGYHEASVLSENCNTSLPRRPKSAFVGSGDMEKLSKLHSQSTTNLSKMASHSKSTTSLGMTGRKKKTAPPPPPAVRASNPSINLEPASPVVASQSTTPTEESLSSHQALDSLASITSNILTDTKDDSKPFGSTDSGIAPETSEKLSETEDFRPATPPPPPLFLDEPADAPEPPEKQKEQPEKEETEELPTTITTTTVIKKEDNLVKGSSTNEEVERLKKPNAAVPEQEVLDEIDWQYQLPSPPKAFRDSSPIRHEDTNSESRSVTDFKDSVVTSPELFEKLKSIEDTQSVSTFVGEEPPLNTLSLENLEKRKSLVYNRELSTSLKMNDEDTFTNSLNKFESTFIEVQKSSQNVVREPKFIQKSNNATNTLPNFKISTYDKPKQKIKVFEDDTIRSNTEYMNKSANDPVLERKTYSSTLSRSYMATSMENVAIRKSSLDNQREEKEYNFYRPEKMNVNRNFGPISTVFRSESFSTDNTWSPAKPVSRSKSFLALNGNAKYKMERQNSGEEGMERSNSLYDVSGLQSLGVIRLIQNKLNTPTASLENLNVQEQPKIKPEPPKEIPQPKLPPPEIAPKTTTTTTEKIYKYRGPPSINMGTWSDRPKIPVSVKEDEDYKLGNNNNISSKLIVNTTNNHITSNNSIEIKNKNKELVGDNASEPSISIKVNGTEVPSSTTETKPGNVVIKIGAGAQPPKIIDNQKFISHTTAVGYRKPFTDINKNQRPYSIAFSSEYDISRVPVVRSVELKKPYKDFGNTSVTQIYQEPVGDNKDQQNGFVDDKKPVVRVRSFNPNGAPVVRGFKTMPRERETFEANSQVPFSQVTLRRTESSKIFDEKPKEPSEREVKPPPPPMMPKVVLRKPFVKPVEPELNPRDQLLSAIRNFGGKKGLKSVKV